LFHSWSAGGRRSLAYSMLLNRLRDSPRLVDIVYQCQMCGACDVSCKNQMDLEPLETLIELRIKCVEKGQFPTELVSIIDSLKKEDNMMQKPRKDRGRWAEGLDVKKLPEEKAEVLFHAGCRFSFDEELWPVTRATVTLLQQAGVDVGIFEAEEACCGGRAYELGFQGEFMKFLDHNVEAWRNAGVKTIVTPCSDCYGTFKAWYSRFGRNGFQILHSVEYIERLVKTDKLRLANKVPLRVSYHDPCHLGRLSEPYLYSSPGKPYVTPPRKVLGTMLIYEPPKPWRRGAGGVYESPRNILRSVPGLRLVEMHRVKEYAWCCGAGGGVKEAYPEFALWTAKQRLMEAKAVGAQALVTACGWCERNFKDAANVTGINIQVYDIAELIQKSVEAK
ncbi:MAG: (Fe-S)-binding protein, partial [Candidatus Bathyarchaeia archaeon]